jgi:transposase
LKYLTAYGRIRTGEKKLKEKDKRLYPISGEVFNQKVLSAIEKFYIWKGRSPKAPHYKVFCTILYILRTGCPWRDVPEAYSYWHMIYDRFSWGSGRGLWAKILLNLQKKEGIVFDEVITDSTTMKVRRCGGGQKGGRQTKGKSHAGISTKFHGVITGKGQLSEGFLAVGEVSDEKAALRLSEGISGCAVIAGRGYDSDEFRREPEGNSNTAVIPGRKNRKKETV